MEKESIDNTQKLPLQITDAVWERILPFLTACPKVYVDNPENCRLFLSAILWITKEGATWRGLPAGYGNWNAIYQRFSRWCDAGVFESLQATFHTDVEISALLVDSTIVRAHACAAGAPQKKGGQTEQALGRSCGGFTTKIHLSLTDTGVPMRFILSAGQCHDATEASVLIQGFECAHVIGDRGYDADAFIAAIQAQQAEAVIPPKKNRVVPRDYDKVLYKTRNFIERFIGHLKQYRRVSSRYDKLAVRYLGFLHFAAILIQCK